MTDEYEKEEDEEYEDGEASSESEEEYEDEAEGAEASDESEGEGEDSVASWGYEEKKSRFSKEMIAGFAAIAVLLTVFGVVSYKKMTGADDSGKTVAAPDASLGNPDGSLGDPGETPSEEDPNDPFRAGAENDVVVGDLGPQSEPGQGDGTSNASLAGDGFGNSNSTNDGSTDFSPNNGASETASLFPGSSPNGQDTPIDPFGNNASLGNDQPFASNSETPDLFSGQSEPGPGSNSEPPFGSSSVGTPAATDEFGQPLASNEFGSGQPSGSTAFPNNGTSEFADSPRPDPFGGPDLSNGTSSVPFDAGSTNFGSSQPGSTESFPQDNQFAQNEPNIEGPLDSSFAGDSTSMSQPELNDGTTGFGSPSSNEPFGSTTGGGESGPTGLFDRGSETPIDGGGLNDPATTALSSNSGFENDTLPGSEFGSPDNNGSPGSGSTFDKGSSATSSTPFGNEEPFGTSGTGSADSVLRNPETASRTNDPFSGSTSEPSIGFDAGNGFDNGPSEPANLFPDTSSGPSSTAATDAFQPPITSSPENSFPDSSASPVSSGPFGNQSFSTGSPAGPSTFASQPSNSGTYTVQDGDSYWNISKKVYGTAKYFQVLADHNRRTIADPQKMKAGVAIETPPASILQRKMKTVRRTSPTGLAGRIEPSGRADGADSAGSPGSAISTPESVVVSRRQTQLNEPAGILFNEQGYPLFRIGKTDTLTSIASDHLGRASRWQQVYNMNRDQLQSPDKLQIGMLLKLPADASRVPLVDRTSSLR